MESNITDILKKHWGHASFRPLQEDIIQSAISGRDTIALLPTGGGKSVCFQVPAMAMEGVCIVVSPLIALMQDQVHTLKQKGISAIAINSTLSKKEIDYALDNVVYGKVKFLYLSPERLKSDILIARVAKMKVCLLAIDEAHCISQWGHDFRPAYRQLAEFRELIPKTPTIALTATAVPEVIDEISEQLTMSHPAVFQKSFVRDNLIYVVQEENQKMARLENIVKRIGGTGIIYVPTRRDTVSQAKMLRAKGIAAVAYHGGMEHKDRKEAQELWIKNRAQVMVATNAFGMGIDKPDVRFVVHMSIPQSLEAYFQEAGRAGRDGQLSYAICLINENDRQDLIEKVSKMVPSQNEIKQTFRALTNHFQLAMGSAMYISVPFDITAFAKHYKLNLHTTFRALKILEMAEIITLSDAIYSPSRLKVLLGSKDLYSFEIGNPKYEPLIHLLLRSYEGIFDQSTRINENNLGVRLKISAGDVKQQFQQLEQMRVIRYQEQTDAPFISFQNERPAVSELKINEAFVEQQQKRHTAKMNAILEYSRNDMVCRSIQLVAYFGETKSEPCGKCDVCLANKQGHLNEVLFQAIKAEVLTELKKESLVLRKLQAMKNHSEKDVLKVVRWLGDNNVIEIAPDNKLTLLSD